MTRTIPLIAIALLALLLIAGKRDKFPNPRTPGTAPGGTIPHAQPVALLPQ